MLSLDIINMLKKAAVSYCLKHNEEKGMYYNTTNEKGDKLISNLKKAKNQKEIVLSKFQRNWNKEYTPEIMEYELKNEDLINQNTPLTSIRRAFSDLKKEGYITKTDQKHIGHFGRMTYLWKLK
jgi:hypothetical protein